MHPPLPDVGDVAAEEAKALTDAHEDYAGNPEGHKLMDLHNNWIGRTIGSMFEPQDLTRLSARKDPVEVRDYTPLRDAVKAAVDIGRTVMMINPTKGGTSPLRWTGTNR
ncbi:DUF6973 domain-containing protein [Amycolatopsis sp. lyj-90]|uniref:DUF6973 domain-containing protein n=1 Tax=Amycolatopsis sp. lyj-90 TaxID=2789285 RepID=UPI00397A231E